MTPLVLALAPAACPHPCWSAATLARHRPGGHPVRLSSALALPRCSRDSATDVQPQFSVGRRLVQELRLDNQWRSPPSSEPPFPAGQGSTSPLQASERSGTERSSVWAAAVASHHLPERFQAVVARPTVSGKVASGRAGARDGHPAGAPPLAPGVGLA